MREHMPWDLEIVRRPRSGSGFQVLPWSRVVERTFGWLNLQQRLSKNCETLCDTSEAWILASMTGLMRHRLVRSTSSYTNLV